MNDLKSIKNVLVIGSCVAHDFAKKLLQYNECVNFNYIWRVSTLSLLSKKPSYDNLFNQFIRNEDEIKTFNADWVKSFDGLLSHDNSYDLIIIDYVRDIYDVVKINESFITYGVEVDKYSLLNKFEFDFQIFKYNSIDYIKYWEDKFPVFVDLISKFNTTVINVLPRFAFHSFNQSDEFELQERYNIYENHKKGFFLYEIHKRVKKLFMPSLFAAMPDFPLLLDINHRWGINPVHFNDEVYSLWIDDFLKNSNYFNSFESNLIKPDYLHYDNEESTYKFFLS